MTEAARPPSSSDHQHHDPDVEARDRLRRRVLWKLPSGLYLLGSTAGGRRNLMTINWASQVSLEPKLVAVSVEREALTHRLVDEGRIFTLSLLARDDRAVVRHFAKPAVDDPGAGTLAGEAVRAAPSGAPILAAAAAWLDCAVREQIDCGSHTLFVGEVTGCGFGPDEEVPILRMEDTRMSYGG